MNVRIEIDTKTFVRFWLVVIGFVLAGLLIYSASTALLIIGIAFFMAIALNPPVNLIAKRMPGKSRVAGTAIAYVLVLIALGLIIFLVVPTIVEQTSKLATTIPNLINATTQEHFGLSEFISKYHLQGQIDSIVEAAKTNIAELTKGVGYGLVAGIGSFFSIITSAILIVVLTFLMLVEGPFWLKKIWSIYHNKSKMEYHRKLVRRMYGVITSYVVGQLSVSAIGALSAGLVVFVLSLMFNIPMNLIVPSVAIVFVLALIPLFGAIIGGILVSLILLLNSISAAIIFLITFIIYQQIEANYISPRIQSKRMELSALFVLIAVTVGVYMFGIVGGVISIPVAGCIKVLIEDYFDKAKIKREQNAKPLNRFFKKIQEK